MKLIFICSSLEPGKDGVGDYTRRLAGELIRQGQEVRILALNDKASKLEKSAVSSQQLELTSGLRPLTAAPISVFSVSDFQDLQQSEGTEIECLRLPMALSWAERVKLAREWVARFKPDWVSLQFVVYGFHPKGLCFGLSKQLMAIAQQTKRHIMFHELWIGYTSDSKLSHKVVGTLQRYLIKDMIRKLEPRVLHTSNDFYRSMLGLISKQVEILPLFSNIPLAKPQPENVISMMQKHGVAINETNRSAHLIGLHFGSWHPDLDSNPVLCAFKAAADNLQRMPCLICVGRMGETGRRVLEAIITKFGSDIRFLNLGEQPEDVVSNLMQFADFGITTGGKNLLWKSSTVAAFMEHGLPVITLFKGINGHRDKNRSNSVGKRAFLAPTELGTFLLSDRGQDQSLKHVAASFLQALEHGEKVL